MSQNEPDRREPRAKAAAGEPIKRRKLSDEVVQRLEAAIRDGVYPPGDTLPPERDLMQLYGVGRPSIREALYALQRIGLVRLVSGERPRVIEPSPKHLLNELGSTARHLLDQADGPMHFEQARLFLELSLVRYACLTATDAQLDTLGEALLANAAALDDPEAFRRTDVAFHRVLVEMSGNPIFVGMYDAIVEWLILQRPLMRRSSDSYSDHQRIYAAIRARDVIAATNAIEQHLNEANKHYSRS
ncbi:transcriptional regulator NanR [Devosia sp. YIM 151766]|uniref:transcriptional regulator NanR n=1 Tax=Devosia sp. YIM 151766 TaxID=3017325 RepID=UPI00255C2A0D|nr:transcriptional regulator NanR [Devosia sp. YIM 151766]WIY53900.1 transcriptional regulator NanR [Devosia sp. YIM 151766]